MSQKDDKKKYKTEFDLTELSTLFLWLALLSPLFGILLNKVFKINFDQLGTYGDLLGGSTLPFLTFASILFIIRSINIQKEQLSIQRDEISLVREELEDAKNALQEQSKTARLNRYENTFYLLINDIRQDIQNMGIGDNYKGYSYLDYLFKTFNKTLEKTTNSLDFDEKTSKIRKEYFNEDFFKIYGQAIEEALYSLPRGVDYSVFEDHIQQVFLLIERNINLLDDWDIKFYLEYLFNVTRKEALILYLLFVAVVFNKTGINSIKKLKLLDYINKFDTGNSSDYKFIVYVVENDFNILPPFVFEKSSKEE
jgi:hypothetical protein